MTGRRRLLSGRGATTAIEFALVTPIFILFVFGMIGVFGLVVARRAMDYGVEKALRYAAAHSGGSTNVVAAYRAAAGAVWGPVGTNSTVSVSPDPFTPGQTVTVSVSYAWAPPAGLSVPDNNAIFTPVTLAASGAVRVGN